MDIIFNFVGTILGLGLLGYIYTLCFRLYRRIPTLEKFTPLQKRILIYQLFPYSIWVLFAFIVFLVGTWSGYNFSILASPPGLIIGAVLNWILLGFIALTSIYPGVSIISAVRSYMDPAKGIYSRLIGFVILAFLLYWTWMLVIPNLRTSFP